MLSKLGVIVFIFNSGVEYTAYVMVMNFMLVVLFLLISIFDYFFQIMKMVKPSVISQSKNAAQTSGSDVSQSEKDLAQKALQEFNKHNYSNALTALVKLEKLRPKDIKVSIYRRTSSQLG